MQGIKLLIVPRSLGLLEALVSMLIFGLVETLPGPGCESFLAALTLCEVSKLGKAPTVSVCFSTAAATL